MNHTKSSFQIQSNFEVELSIKEAAYTKLIRQIQIENGNSRVHVPSASKAFVVDSGRHTRDSNQPNNYPLLQDKNSYWLKHPLIFPLVFKCIMGTQIRHLTLALESEKQTLYCDSTLF